MSTAPGRTWTSRARAFLLLAGVVGAFASCTASSPTSSGCKTSVSTLNWSIWVGPTPNAVEVKVGQDLSLGLLTFNIGCTIPSYDEVWTHTNPTAARLTSNPNGKGANLLGLEPGTTVVTGEAIGANGERGRATTSFRVVP